VLLPGLDGTGRLFKPFVDAVGADAATTVVDYTSPEVSTYADCRVAAERRLPQDEPYILVGESFSGPVAVSIAATHPPGLCGLALVGSFLSSPRSTLKWLSAFIPVLPTHNGPDWLTDFLLLGRHGTPELRTVVRDAMSRVTPRAVRERLREIARVNVCRELSAVRVPVLYLRGVKDKLVPSSCGEWMGTGAWAVS
jgi:pimeloyl-[acyl-carrier protein] methyl ester esterase